MSTYRWLAYDLRTNVALAELPLAVKSFSGQLNGAGAFSATMGVDVATSTALKTATTPERTIVFVERDGVILDGFIIWRRTFKPEQPVRIEGASIPSYLRRNRIVTSWAYVATDQFTMARGIVDHLQSQTGANIGIATGSGTCGVLRDRTYYGYERKNLGDALAELAAVDNGFDWAIDCSWNTSVPPAPQKVLTLSYPRRGRIAGSTGVIFELGKNIVDYTFDEDGSRSARAVDAIGSGDGVDMKISTAVDTSLLDAGYPLTAETIAHKDVVVQATLDAHATAAMRARSKTPTFLSLVIDPSDVDAGLGTWIVGDDALVRITDTNFPLQSDGQPGYQQYHRIIAYSVDIPDDGPETVTVVLGSITT
jgi:hypothetical protein